MHFFRVLVYCCVVLSLSRGTEGQKWTEEDSIDGLKLVRQPTTDGGTEHDEALPGSTQGPFSFLSELQEFLQGDAWPQRAAHVGVNQDSPLTLGSSETLAPVINSSTPMFMSSNLMVQRVELALPAVLLELLRHRLVEAMDQIMQVMREEEAGDRLIQKLHRLKALSDFPMDGPATGESQYRAFLLLKAVHTVVHLREAEKRPRVKKRSARQRGSDPGTSSSRCRLHSLPVSLAKFGVAPGVYDIKTCYGLCSFPLLASEHPTYHAVLLNSLIGDGRVQDVGRPSLCCVPVAYDDVLVLDADPQGVGGYVLKKFMEATECGCR